MLQNDIGCHSSYCGRNDGNSFVDVYYAVFKNGNHWNRFCFHCHFLVDFQKGFYDIHWRSGESAVSCDTFAAVVIRLNL